MNREKMAFKAWLDARKSELLEEGAKAERVMFKECEHVILTTLQKWKVPTDAFIFKDGKAYYGDDNLYIGVDSEADLYICSPNIPKAMVYCQAGFVVAFKYALEAMSKPHQPRMAPESDAESILRHIKNVLQEIKNYEIRGGRQ